MPLPLANHALTFILISNPKLNLDPPFNNHTTKVFPSRNSPHKYSYTRNTHVCAAAVSNSPNSNPHVPLEGAQVPTMLPYHSLRTTAFNIIPVWTFPVNQASRWRLPHKDSQKVQEWWECWLRWTDPSVRRYHLKGGTTKGQTVNDDITLMRTWWQRLSKRHTRGHKESAKNPGGLKASEELQLLSEKCTPSHYCHFK